MSIVRFAFYGVYLVTCLYLGRFKFERLKKTMTVEERDRYASDYVSKWSRWIIERSGSKVNAVGTENIPEETCVFVSNHQSYFDILVILGYINKPLGFIAKKELETLPFISYWMKQIHCVFIDRENPRESVKSILEGVNNLNKGYSMHIAPEGTRSRGPHLGEFKKGSMKLAVKAEVPIVPVALNNIYKITGGKNFLDLKATEVDIIFSRPVCTKDLSREEQNDLSEYVRNIIQNNLDTYNG